MSLIKLNFVTKIYDGSAVPVKALNQVSLDIEAGEFASIVGPSGSGKTTLLNMIGGLDVPTSGNIIVDDVDISTYKPDELVNFRLPHIGFVFQAYNLIPVFTAKEKDRWRAGRLHDHRAASLARRPGSGVSGCRLTRLRFPLI